MARDMMDKWSIKGSDMVLESFQLLMEIFIWEIGSKIDFMDMGFMFIMMGKDTKGNCSKVWKKDKGSIFIKMEGFMKDNGATTKDKVRESKEIRLKEYTTKVNGRMTKSKVMVGYVSWITQYLMDSKHLYYSMEYGLEIFSLKVWSTRKFIKESLKIKP